MQLTGGDLEAPKNRIGCLTGVSMTSGALSDHAESGHFLVFFMAGN